jgi:hypothetical protein
MAQLILPRPRLAAPVQEADPDGAFWCPAIGRGFGAALDLLPRIDVLAQRAALLPVRASLTRPVVGQYLCMVKTLAATWSLHSRPALLASMGALLQFGAAVGHTFAADAEALAPGCPERDRVALRVLDALQRGLGAPLAAFAALGAKADACLAHMARLDAELQADTRLVAARLQADHLQLFLLAQRAGALQGKLDAADMDQDRAPHGCALEGVRRQLDQLHADQGATRAEADYLQSLLPTLAPYLDAVLRIEGAIGAVLAGVRTLATAMEGLRRTPDGALRQLQAALPHWLALADAAAVTKPSAPRT